MKRYLFAVVALFISTVAMASNVIGYRNVDGYTWNGTYWTWPDGSIYNRVTYPAYDYYGRYYLGVQYVQVKTAVPTTINYNSPNWKADAIKILGEREERTLFDKTFSMLAETSTAPHVLSNYRNTYGASGTTLYQHQQVTIKDVWGDYNPALGMQQLHQLANAQRTNTQETIGAFASLVGDDQVARARLAEIMANRDAAVAFLQALKTSQSREVTIKNVVGAGQGTVPNGDPKAAVVFDKERFTARVVQQCGTCHLGDKVSGGFDLKNLSAMPFEARLSKVWGRLTHPDPKKRMPLAGGFSPGVPQTDVELREWFNYLFASPGVTMEGAKE